MLAQYVDVVGPLAQRGKLEVDDVEAEQEVLAERAPADLVPAGNRTLKNMFRFDPGKRVRDAVTNLLQFRRYFICRFCPP